MKNTFITISLLLLMPILLIGQRKSRSSKNKDRPKTAYEIIFGLRDKDFELEKVPDEWKEESVVILCQKTYVSYRDDYVALLQGTGNEIITEGLIRRKVKLLDQAAVDNFSEIYFQDEMKFNLTVIKENGDRVKIDDSNAIKVENEVPKIFRDNYKNTSYLKVAVPQLAVGDIIDYTKEFKDNDLYIKEVFTLLSSYYPIVKQELIYDVDRGLTFVYNTFNNSTELKYDSKGGLKSNGKFSKKIKRYRLSNKMAPKVKDERWSYDYSTKPSLKILVLCRNHLFSESGLNTLLQPDIERYFKSSVTYENLHVEMMVRKLNRAFKKTDLKEKSTEEIINTLYTAMKFDFLYENNEKDIQSQIDDGDIFPLSRNRKSMNSVFFARVFSSLLNDFKIPSDYVMYASPRTGGLDNAVTFRELEFAVYVPKVNKYYFPINNFSYPGEIPSYALNADAIKLDVKESFSRNPKYTDITLPGTNFNENIFECNTDVELSNNKDLTYSQNCKAKGFYKNIYAPTFLYHSDFAKDYLIEYSHDAISEKIQLVHDYKNKNEGNIPESLKPIFGQHKEFDEKKEKYLLDWFKDEYSASEFEHLAINKYGINTNDEDLDFDVRFIAEEAAKKAGPNLFIEVNQLIGDQIKLDDEDKEVRINDADLGHAKSIVNTVNFIIPDGYVFKSIDDLNVSLENEIAKFEANATMEGNTLILKTKKDYKNGMIAKDNFPKLVEVLDFAYDYSRKKIIISKI